MRGFRYVGLVLVTAVAAAGCGGTVIDDGKLEDEITDDAAAAGLVVDAVDCPSPDAQAGETFTCTVTVKGQEEQLDIEQVDDEGNVEYSLEPLFGGTSGAGAGGDEESVRSVIEAVNADITALCDYATDEYKAEIVEQTGQESCEQAVAEEDNDPIREYDIAVEGDTATVTGTDADGEVAVALERAEDGTWEISAIN